MSNNDNNQTAGDTVEEIGTALKKDAEATVDHVKDAGKWVSEKAGDAKDAAENEAEKHGLNEGDPNRNDD